MEIENISQKILDTYKEKTPGSMAHQELAGRYLPGGDTRSATYFSPYPVYMEKGRGCWLYDADGNEYLDMLGNYTSLIHGHALPTIVEAIREQAVKGTVFGAVGSHPVPACRTPLQPHSEHGYDPLLQLGNRGDPLCHSGRPRVYRQRWYHQN